MNLRHPNVKARDDELMRLYPHVPTYELAERFDMTEDAIRSRATYHKVAKLPGCPRKRVFQAERRPRENVADILLASNGPDAAGRALLDKGIDPCSLAAEMVGIVAGAEQAERERERQEQIVAERTPCASKTKEAILEGIERIMAYVKWNPECRTTSVAKAIGCCKSVAFYRLCRMEDDGMVTRYKSNNISYWSVA